MSDPLDDLEPPPKQPEQPAPGEPKIPGFDWEKLKERARARSNGHDHHHGAQQDEPDEPLEVINAAELLKNPAPPRQWFVPDWVPDRNVTLISGDGGLGKTLLMIQLAVCASAGIDWLGQRVDRRKVLAVCCEDEIDEIHRRLEKITEGYGVMRTALADFDIISRVDLDNSMMEHLRDGTSVPTAFQRAIHHRVSAPGGARFLLLDSLHDIFTGDEISRNQARTFIQKACRSIALSMDGGKGGAVIVTLHPSLSGLQSGSGMSGSTGWSNACRSRCYLEHPKPVKNEIGNGEEPPDPDERILTNKKTNYGRVGGVIKMRWQQEPGFFVPILEQAEDRVDAIERTVREKRAEEVFLAGLNLITEQGDYCSSSPGARERYAPVMMIQRKLSPVTASKLKVGDLAGAMMRLLNARVIESAPLKDRGPRIWGLRRTATPGGEAKE